MTNYDRDADAIGSYADGIAALRERHLAGEDMTQLPLFRRKPYRSDPSFDSPPDPLPGWGWAALAWIYIRCDDLLRLAHWH